MEFVRKLKIKWGLVKLRLGRKNFLPFYICNFFSQIHLIISIECEE